MASIGLRFSFELVLSGDALSFQPLAAFCLPYLFLIAGCFVNYYLGLRLITARRDEQYT